MKKEIKLKRLTAEEELAFLKQVHNGSDEKIFKFLRDAFSLLQSRAQMLLGLATICLTITGFSGPRMAAASPYSRVFISCGLFFVLNSVGCIAAGPLRVRWMTQWKAGTIDQTLVAHILRRDLKTRLYKIATALLLVGLTCYLMSVVSYLLVAE